MKSLTVLLCALLMTSIVLVGVPDPALSDEELPELPPMPFELSPGLESYGVWPDVGWNDTTFDFYLNATLDYFWNETIPRLSEIVQVKIDGISYDMEENDTKDTNWTDGKHFLWNNNDRLWSKGLHDFYFYVNVNGSSNTTAQSTFEILNRAPYMLEPPFGEITVGEEFEWEGRATDEDMDPLNWTLTSNMTAEDGELEFEDLNTSFKVKIKCNHTFVRWINLSVFDGYDNLAYWRWELYCVEDTTQDSPNVPMRYREEPDPTERGDIRLFGEGESDPLPTDDGPLHNSDFYWIGDGDNWLWDDNDNWIIEAGGVWTRANIGDYPKDNDDRAFLNETADDLYLVHGANSVVTIGELKLSAGFTGSVTMTIDLIIDDGGAHDGHMEVSSGTWDVNTSNKQINLDGYLHLLDTGTFVERSGIVIVQGAAIQQIRVQDANVLYKLTTDTLNTVASLYDNLTLYQLTVGTTTTYKMDAVTRGYELWTNFTDAAGCGFVAGSTGILDLDGVYGARQANITTADGAPPPTNAWTQQTSIYHQIENATISYFYYFDLSYWQAYVINATFDYYQKVNMNQNVVLRDTAFTDCNLDGLVIGTTSTKIDNMTIPVSCTRGDLYVNGRVEMIDSTFDESNTGAHTTANDAVVSANHNDTADRYLVYIGTTLSKAALTTHDFATGNNVELVAGKFIVDEAAAAETIEIYAGSTFQIGKDVPTASRTLTFDDAVGAGFDIDSAGTLQAIGDEAGNFPMTITSAATPPANYWSGNMGTGDPDIHLENATLEYGRYLTSGGAWTIDNATIDNFKNDAYSVNVQLGGTISEFNDATISNSAQGLLSYVAHANFDNTVIASMTADDIQAEDVKLEFTNSNFDPGQVDLATTGNVVSHTHNDSANEVHLMATALNKNTIVNDYASGDFVRLYIGSLTINEASASDDILIDVGATLTLNNGETHTFDSLANFTVNGTAKLNGDMTAAADYFDFYTPGMSWLNDSDVTSADLCQYYGGFNFSIGAGSNSTLNNYTASITTHDISLNITSETYLAKGSGIVWHMNASLTDCAMCIENVDFDFGNLTAGESYRLYDNGVLVGTKTADTNGMVFFTTVIDDVADHLNLTYYSAAAPPPPPPGPGQYDRWIVGFEYSKHPFTNEVHFTAIFNYDHNASIYIWTFGDGSVIETLSPNITRNFAFAFYSTEDVKLTIIATDGNRYWMDSPIVLDNTLWIALLCLAVISLAVVAVMHSRRARTKTELVMVETEGR